MKKPLPILRSDKEAEHFVATSDLTDYDLTGLHLMRFAFEPKNRPVDQDRSRRQPRASLAIKRWSFGKID